LGAKKSLIFDSRALLAALNRGGRGDGGGHSIHNIAVGDFSAGVGAAQVDRVLVREPKLRPAPKRGLHERRGRFYVKSMIDELPRRLPLQLVAILVARRTNAWPSRKPAQTDPNQCDAQDRASAQGR
ncbi:hypothetical protein AC1031_016645, partial [Aphanomyces cochlioides]